ncbi:MAG: DUF2142 domain-containing protein [Cryobacterium sp.]|nr:DUF2142 domain-containing protein [Cryobacterium sp.]MCO5294626.1 DUF2142 domain-containing protein [Homoserinimonas sp.]
MSRRIILLTLTPLLALTALVAWALASPIGASPDDDYHQASIWCANPAKPWACAEGSTPQSRMVPAALVGTPCFAHRPDLSSDCQLAQFSLDADAKVETDRGNFVGAYPPVYYLVQNLLVSPDIQLSIMLMRILNATIFVAISLGLWLLLPIPRRSEIGLTWLVSSIPLGIFLIPSLNPSSWTVMAIPTVWFALTGYFETSKRARIGLGVIYAIAMIMAAGSRADGAAYAGFATLLAVLVSYRFKKEALLQLVLPLVMCLFAVASILSSRQSGSALGGFGNSADITGTMAGDSAAGPVGGFANIAFNLIQLPSLWAGAFGEFGLGWLDTQVPPIVTLGGVACFVIVVAKGAESPGKRKIIALALTGLALVVIPIWVLYRGQDFVGQNVQPRYLLPLIVLLAAISLYPWNGRQVVLGRPHLLVIWITVSVANAVSLYVNLHRYIYGDVLGALELDGVARGWWPVVSPTFVLVLGSISFVLLCYLILRPLSRSGSSSTLRPVSP